MNSIDRLGVANVATERVARIGWIGNESAAVNNSHNCIYPPGLRVGGMYFDQLGHARIVGQLHGYFVAF